MGMMFGHCNCANRVGRNMVQMVTGLAGCSFFRNARNTHDAEFQDPSFLTCTVTRKWWNGAVDTISWSIDPVTTKMTGPAPYTGTDPQSVVASHAVTGFSQDPWRGFGGVAFAVIRGQDTTGWLPSMGPLYTDTEGLSNPYTFADAAKLVIQRLNMVGLLNPTRLLTGVNDDGTTYQFQLGYPTDAKLPGSIGVYQQMTVFGHPLFSGSVMASGGGVVGQAIATANSHSGFYSIFSADGSTIVGAAVATGNCTANKGAAWYYQRFGEQTNIEGQPPGIVTAHEPGEYIFQPVGVGDLFIDVSTGYNVLTPRRSEIVLSVPPGPNPRLPGT